MILIYALLLLKFSKISHIQISNNILK
jgi:hypothetical protein